MCIDLKAMKIWKWFRYLQANVIDGFIDNLKRFIP